MPAGSLNHAKRSPANAQSNRITVLDNGKVDWDWFDDPSPEPLAVAGSVLWSRSGLPKSPWRYPIVMCHVTSYTAMKEGTLRP